MKRLLALILSILLLITCAAFPVSAAEYITTTPGFYTLSPGGTALPHTNGYAGGNLNEYVATGTSSVRYGDSWGSPTGSAMGAVNTTTWGATGGDNRFISPDSETSAWIEYTFSQNVIPEFINFESNYGRAPSTIKIYAEENPLTVIDTTTATPVYTIDDAFNGAPGKGYDIATAFAGFANGIGKIRFEFARAEPGYIQLCDIDIFGKLAAAPEDREYTVYYQDVDGVDLLNPKSVVDVYPYDSAIIAEPVSGYFTPAALTYVDGTDSYTFVYRKNLLDAPITLDPTVVSAICTCGGSDAAQNHVNTREDYSGDVDYNKPDFYKKENMVDGDDSTAWIPAHASNETPGAMVEFSFADTVNLYGTRIRWSCNDNGSTKWHDSSCTWGGGCNGVNRAKAYEIWVSNSESGDDFVLVYSEDEKLASDTDTFDLGGVAAKRVRLVTKGTDWRFLGIREVTFDGYVMTNILSSAPAEEELYYADATELVIPMEIVSTDRRDPATYLTAGNWKLVEGNATVSGVVVTKNTDKSNAEFDVYDVALTVVPDGNDFALELDLPASFATQDKITLTRIASEDVFSNEVATGENKATVKKSDILREYDGTEYSTFFATVNVQSVLDGANYKGYDRFEIKLVDVTNTGDIFNKLSFFELSADAFSRMDENTYICNIPYKKKNDSDFDGADYIKATVALYGISEGGTRKELDRRTVKSNIITLAEPKAVTGVKGATDHLTIWDVLPEVIDQLGYLNLPKFSENDWKIWEQLCNYRGKSDEYQPVKDAYDQAIAAKTPAKQDYLEIDMKKFRVSIPYFWNYLNDLHIKSVTLNGVSFADMPTFDGSLITKPEAVVEGYSLTFCEKDYTALNAKPFNDKGEPRYLPMRLQPVAGFDGKEAPYVYNSIRRSFENEQLMPIIFNIAWWTADPPFENVTVTVDLPQDWTENYGITDVAVYRFGSYNLERDNDVELTMIAEDLNTAPVYRNGVLKHAVSFEVSGDKLWSSYCVVNQLEVPSSVPSNIEQLYTNKGNVATGGDRN